MPRPKKADSLTQRELNIKEQQRQTRVRAEANDIGDLPPVVNPESRAKAEQDVVYFCRHYCPSVITRPIAPVLQEYLELLAKAIDIGGYIQVMFPRGSGKTTLQKCFLVWALLTGRLKFVVVFGANAAMSKGIVSDCWNLLQGKEILDDFPEVAYPIARLEGVPIRSIYQTYKGQRTLISINSKEFHLPTIEGSASSGSILKALGAGSAVRGLAHLDKRPDFVLLDDIQTKKSAQSTTATAKLESWLSQDVMGLAGPTSSLAICSTATPLKDGDLTDILQDKLKHPEWTTIKHPLITGDWSDRWDEYDKLYLAGLIAGDLSVSLEYYKKHRASLDRKLVVLDEGAYNGKNEISAIQHARNLKIKLGDLAYQTEYQLTPLRSSLSVTVQDTDIYTKLTHVPKWHLPQGTRNCVAYIDVMQDKLRYCVTAFGPGNIASVIDYGLYPEKGEIASRMTSVVVAGRRISKALLELMEYLSQGSRYLLADKPVKVSAIWVDSGWMSKVVYGVCNLAAKKHRIPVLPTKGTSSIGFNSGFKKKILATGDNVALCESTEKQQYVSVNADYWKKMSQSLWLGTTPLSKNSLSLYGEDKATHVEFAREICAEKLEDQGTTSKGYEFYQWKVDGPNHYLDCLAGTLACAAWMRYFESSLGMREIKELASKMVKEASVDSDVGKKPQGDDGNPQGDSGSTAKQTASEIEADGDGKTAKADNGSVARRVSRKRIRSARSRIQYW